MEAVHKPQEKFHISGRINVCNFLREWLDILEETHQEHIQIQECDVKTKIAGSMKLDLDTLNKIAEVCSPRALDCANESTIDQACLSDIPHGVDLKTAKIREKEIKNWSSEKWFKNKLLRNRYKHCNQALYDGLRNNLATSPKNLISGPDVILSIQIFRPVKSNILQDGRSNIKLVLEQEVCVLGRQSLPSFQSQIQCTADYTLPNDLSENPSIAAMKINRNPNYSGFFYIEDTFYNDMRNESNVDYSKVIRDWTVNKKIGPFKTKLMEETCFGELTIRLGYPYLYQHQGQCEHLFVFNDLRMLSPDDCQDLDAYPLIKCLSRKKANKCMVCHQVIAKWVTVDNERVAENPFFFCNNCFLSFNYKDGKKIGTFKAYQYVDRTALR